MVWFKVDDNLAFHPKALAAGNAAMGLWVRAGSWSAQQLTDGRIPDSILASLGTVKQAETLARVGLWRRAEGAWEFHEWNGAGRQPTRASVEAERAASAERQRKHREAQDLSRRDESVTNTVSHGDVTPLVTPAPTRPDPTIATEVAISAAKTQPKASRRKAETALPEEWRPNETHVAYARAEGLDVKHEYQQFRAHAEANERKQRDWNAAFRLWLGNAVSYGRGTKGQALADPWEGKEMIGGRASA
jgi:hypothetical protein